MLKRNLWKLIFSFVIVVWAAWTLYPLSDQDFGKYVREHATAKKGEFAALVSEANELHISGKAPSTFVKSTSRSKTQTKTTRNNTNTKNTTPRCSITFSKNPRANFSWVSTSA